MFDLPREEWMSALCAIPETRLTEVTDSFPGTWKVRPKVLPQNGLGMLKMRDSALGDAYYLGEFPLSSCWVKVITDDHSEAEGAALVMDDRVEYAERLALCDAVLSARLPGWQAVANLILEGCSRRREINKERNAMLTRTRVDFSLLDDVGERDA
jgi:alpha-D-ribose 1-methylphosphonate 5-triphosphate synthase subunit PhnG